MEKSSFGREAGFSITVGTNGSRVLTSLDFDFARARSVDCNHVSDCAVFAGFYVNQIILLD